jgi:hypothetical protein
MRGYLFRWFYVAAGLLLLGVPLSGQTRTATNPKTISEAHLISNERRNERPHIGFPQDWSSRYMVIPGVTPEDVLAKGKRDPRLIYNMLRRQAALKDSQRQRQGQRQSRGAPSRRRSEIDWAVSLENGFVGPGVFPAKYSFDIDTEDCNSDYVLFGLQVTSGTQANLVGINNLYTTAAPACNNGSPWVAFAYNTVTQPGGQILTSPTLSADGTMVAFVESTPTASYFHVLVLPSPIPAPPLQAGTVLNPLTPTPCMTPKTPGCMTTTTIETTATNSNSSPWIDYGLDAAFVGADNGLLYKIQPVFNGQPPLLVTNADWPATVSTQANSILTDPIVDDNADRIFLGDGEGYLYAVTLHGPIGTYSAQLTIGWAGFGPGTGVVDPPIVANDPANPAIDQVFAFTGCSEVLGIGGAITQVPADFTSSAAVTTGNTVDLGSGHGDGDCTTGNVHTGAFDNQFYLTGSASGHLIACGFVSGTANLPLIPSNPQMYFFPFAGNVITSTGSSQHIVNDIVGNECSPLTEFYNGTTDSLFYGVGNPGLFGLLANGSVQKATINATSLTAPSCSLFGPTSTCVQAPPALQGVSGIVIDNVLSNGGTNFYFSTMAPGSVNGQNCSVHGGAPNPYCAVKLAQSDLQ